MTCSDCGSEFVFTASEHEYFVEKGFNNYPTRCQDCRAAKRAAQGDTNSQVQRYDAVCSGCGVAFIVPYQPKGDRPIYCSDCFAAMRGNR